VFLMLTGLATLGILSGTMASFFRTSRTSAEAAPPQPPAPAAADAQLAEVREQLAAIVERLAQATDRNS
jgi:hypothetical protein